MPTNSWTFDPNSDYGASGGSHYTMPMVSGPGGFLDNNEDASYYRFIAPFAGGQDAFSQFVRGKMGEVIRNFRAAQATNTNLQLPDYLRQFTEQTFRNQYQDQAPWQRGEASGSQMGAGRMKWYQGSR